MYRQTSYKIADVISKLKTNLNKLNSNSGKQVEFGPRALTCPSPRGRKLADTKTSHELKVAFGTLYAIFSNQKWPFLQTYIYKHNLV